jgi:hypothetical protein
MDALALDTFDSSQELSETDRRKRARLIDDEAWKQRDTRRRTHG